MYSFGKIPPRAIHATGVASVLGEGCRVFYDSLFNTSGLGRVSDLLAARLRSQGLDELKLRALILFGFFEGYRSQSQDGGLDEPLVIECGMDEEKIAVGVAFQLRDMSDFNASELSERITQGRPENSFERLLMMIHANSDHALLRFGPVFGRVEVISLIAIPGTFDLSEKQPVIVIELKSEGETDATAPLEKAQPREYVQLADLDYVELLTDKASVKRKKASFSTGEVLAQSFSNQTAVDATKVKVAGTREDNHESEIRFSKDHEDVNDFVRIAGNIPKEEKTHDGIGFSVQAMLGKVWPFKRKKFEVDSADQQQAQASAGDADSEVKGAAPQAEADQTDHELVRAPMAPLPEFDESDVKGMSQFLSNSVASGSFFKLVERSQEMAREMKRDPSDSPIKRWIEGFSHEIMAEKVRLAELSRMVTKSIRQKEFDLKHREQQFADDLRRKDEALHQKSTALARAKDQIAQLGAQLERHKGSKGPGGEESNFRQKYELSQRMLTSLREEKSKLAARIDEMKVQSSTSQKTVEATAQIELANLKTKQDQLVRQNMQLKSLNEQLMRRVQKSTTKTNEKVADRQSAMSEELKKKLEAQQKELDRFKARIEEQAKQDAKLVGELTRKEAEIRAIKKELELAKKPQTETKKAG